MNTLNNTLNNLDWSPLLISLKTGLAATIISFILGIYMARKAIKAPPAIKAILDGIMTLPMVLPPHSSRLLPAPSVQPPKAPGNAAV